MACQRRRIASPPSAPTSDVDRARAPGRPWVPRPQGVRAHRRVRLGSIGAGDVRCPHAGNGSREPRGHPDARSVTPNSDSPRLHYRKSVGARWNRRGRRGWGFGFPRPIPRRRLSGVIRPDGAQPHPPMRTRSLWSRNPRPRPRHPRRREHRLRGCASDARATARRSGVRGHSCPRPPRACPRRSEWSGRA